MGSFANIGGRIEINPPIPWREFADSPYYRAFRDGNYPYSLLLDVVEVIEDTKEGVLIRREAVAIAPFDGDELRGDDIGPILDAIEHAHGRGRTFTGRIDVWWPDYEFSSLRFKVTHGGAHQYAPQIAWPPESE